MTNSEIEPWPNQKENPQDNLNSSQEAREGGYFAEELR